MYIWDVMMKDLTPMLCLVVQVALILTQLAT
jgi:hypothetical protein